MCTYLQCDQLVCQVLFHLVPALLQGLWQGWIHYRQQEPDIAVFCLPSASLNLPQPKGLPNKEWGWQTRGVSNVNA